MKKNKIEFSKFILINVHLTAVFFTLVAAYIAIQGGDVGSFALMVTPIWALDSLAVGFYYWKAKAENLMKIAKEVPTEMVENLDEIKQFIE